LHATDDLFSAMDWACQASQHRNIGVDVRQSPGCKAQEPRTRLHDLCDRLFLVGNCRNHEVRPCGEDLRRLGRPGVGDYRSSTAHLRTDVGAIPRTGDKPLQLTKLRQDHGRARLQADDSLRRMWHNKLCTVSTVCKPKYCTW